MALAPPPSDRPLPRLRDDLRLLPGAPTLAGEPRWLIYDPLRHRYFEITEQAFELLAAWGEATRQAVRQRAALSLGRQIDDDDLRELETFLTSSSLTEDTAKGDSRDYLEQAERMHRPLLQRVVHGYLFFRIPLVRPERFLVATYPLIAPIYTRTAAALIGFCGLLGLYLVSRQWDDFTATFLHFFSLEGLLFYGLSLVFVKALHELGHAYTAVRYGVRVPTMGVALLLMFPMLYTDVTDAWKLRSKRQQLAIGAAGMATELAIACLATLAWALLPEGPARSAAFLLATTSWIMSLAVNLNPLMRFDGYYLLADAWGISNLQARSFRLGRWWLRELLFGLGRPPPDRFSRATRNALAAFAFATWIYRFFLFLGIALLVYHALFKVLGVILFVVEIVWFILLPVAKELEAWWLMRAEILKTRRTAVTGALAAVALAVLLVPWNGTVVVPAVLKSAEEAWIHAPAAGEVIAVEIVDGQRIEKGEVLFRLASADNRHRTALIERKIALAKARLARRGAGGRELGGSTVLEQELAALREELSGLEREASRLVVRSPLAGVVRQLDPALHPGRHLNPRHRVALIVGSEKPVASGLMGETALHRVKPGAAAWFIPDDPARSSRPLVLREIAETGESIINDPYLASTHGGPVAVVDAQDGRQKPVSGVHRVTFEVTGAAPPAAAERGVVHVTAEAESLAVAAWRQIARVAIRESGI